MRLAGLGQRTPSFAELMRGRIRSAALWLAACSVHAPLVAQPTAGPLAASELLFEINATGRSTTPADAAVMSMTFSAAGRTTEEARGAAEALSNRLVEIGRRFGAERVTGGSGMSRVGFISEPPPDGAVPPGVFIGEEGPNAAGANQRLGHGSLQLRLPEPSRAAELRNALESASALNVTTAYLVSDERAARQAALSDALGQARREASEFARVHGMRVVRMTRFSESPDRQLELMRMMTMRMIGAGATGNRAEVETSVWVQVSFALAPQ